MTTIEKNPDRVKAFFKDPIIAYAASQYFLAGSIVGGCSYREHFLRIIDAAKRGVLVACADLFCIMAFSQLNWRESLR